MRCSLDISNFLEEISSLSHSIVFLYFFVWITEEGCLISYVMISVQEFLPHSHVSNTAPHPDLRLKYSWRCVTLAEQLIEVPGGCPLAEDCLLFVEKNHGELHLQWVCGCWPHREVAGTPTGMLINWGPTELAEKLPAGFTESHSSFII